jgi:hypothetical protein
MIQDHVDQALHGFAAPIYEAELIRLIEREMVKSGAR